MTPDIPPSQPADSPPPLHTPPAPVLERFTLGPYMTNCYLVRVPRPEWGQERPPKGAGGPCWVVDAGFSPLPMIRRIHELRLRPAAIVLTHAHVDHIAGVRDILREFPGTPVLIHHDEAAWLADPVLNLSEMMGMPVTAPGPDGFLRDGQDLELSGTRWRVMHTPGHSPGGVTLYHAESGQALVGDLIFAGSVGRTDFPGSDFEVLAASIRSRIYTLPDDTKLLPGHGPTTSPGREKRANPFVRAE